MNSFYISNFYYYYNNTSTKCNPRYNIGTHILVIYKFELFTIFSAYFCFMCNTITTWIPFAFYWQYYGYVYLTLCQILSSNFFNNFWKYDTTLIQLLIVWSHTSLIRCRYILSHIWDMIWCNKSKASNFYVRFNI